MSNFTGKDSEKSSSASFNITLNATQSDFQPEDINALGDKNTNSLGGSHRPKAFGSLFAAGDSARMEAAAEEQPSQLVDEMQCFSGMVRSNARDVGHRIDEEDGNETPTLPVHRDTDGVSFA